MERQLYYKYKGDKLIISYCTSLYIDGHWVSNPTTEQIAADGWLPYTPPEPPPYVPEPQDEPYESDVLESVKKMFAPQIEDMTDEEALAVASLFPTWKEALNAGLTVQVGERRWDDGKLWKCKQAHIPQSDWRPENTPALWQEVSVEEWPEWVQPIEATEAYHNNDKVTHNGKHWISEVDNNVWEPGVYG